MSQTKLKYRNIIAERYISFFRSYTAATSETQEENMITIEYDFLHFSIFRNKVRNHGVFMFKIEVWEKVFQ